MIDKTKKEKKTPPNKYNQTIKTLNEAINISKDATKLTKESLDNLGKSIKNQENIMTLAEENNKKLYKLTNLFSVFSFFLILIIFRIEIFSYFSESMTLFNSLNNEGKFNYKFYVPFTLSVAFISWRYGKK